VSARVSIGIHGQGGLVAVKRAPSGAAAVAQLHREAAVLEQARHPGVVELVGVEHRGGDTVLVTRFVGSHSLATAPPLRHDRAVRLLADLASTVADLHERGLVHRRIEPSHVLLGPGGQPVLCGFGAAGAPDHDGELADDVEAVRALAVAVLQEGHGDAAAVSTGRRTRSLLALSAVIALALVAASVLRPLGAVDADPEADPDPVTAVDTDAGAPVVEYAGRRYRVGQPGDVAVVGDWNCDGVATAALLRPETGEVFEFESWEDGTVVSATTVVEGADQLRLVDDGRPCDAWEVGT
jgi:serine/threonine protein kinase